MQSGDLLSEFYLAEMIFAGPAVGGLHALCPAYSRLFQRHEVNLKKQTPATTKTKRLLRVRQPLLSRFYRRSPVSSADFAVM